MAAVFISYSRKDFYFAESLAFHLQESGIPTWLDANQLSPGADWIKDLDSALDEACSVVLVGSRESFLSEYVSGEWHRALEQKKQIIVTRFRAVDLPPELAQAPVVDFRGSFKPALQKLQRLLTTSASDVETAHSPEQRKRIPRVPVWVAFMGLLLASLFMLPLVVFGRWQGSELAGEALWFRILCWMIAPFLLWFVAWHTCVAFLRRRMGMTRLAICIAFFTGLFAFNLLQHFGAHIYPSVLGGGTSPFAQERWPAAICLVALGLCGLVIVVFVRPEDFLRWMPTGKAWDSYRRGRVVRLPDLQARFADLKRFELLHDGEDAVAADRLRAEFINAGAIEADKGTIDPATVVLLTNRTRTAWLEQHSARLQKAAVTVVGTAISLPDSLRWLWRRQWIDFRRWDARPKRKEPIPAVPEALTRLRIPAHVARTEHLLCAMGGLLFVAGGAIMPKNTETMPARELLAIATDFCSVAWGVLAWRLVHRKISSRGFSRALLVTSIVSAVLGTCSLIVWLNLQGELLRIIPAALFLVIGPLLLQRQKPKLEFWYLSLADPETKSAQRLAGRRNWEPLLWLLAYMMLWLFLLDANTGG